MTRQNTNEVGIRAAQLFLDFRLLLLLFVAFRLLLMIVYLPIFQNGLERGVSAGGDFFYYFQLGAFSREGLLPFRDWWSEFPPVPSILNVVVFQIFGRDYTTFAMGYGMLMLIFDAGNLIMVRRIGSRLYSAGTGMALAWIYAVLLAPAVLIWWNFEPMVAFFLLWSLALLIERRDLRSAGVGLVGTLIKFTPALVLAAVWRFRPPRAALRYTAALLGGFVLVYVLLFAQNAAMTAPSLTAQFNKASYETVWALLDGNYTTGNFGPSQERLNPANAYHLVGRPAVVPGFVRLGIALVVGLAAFASARRRDERGMVYFVGLALLVFFLQAQGWSPQWLAQIMPLMLLAFPSRDGILALILLSIASFVEYPFLFIRTGDTGGAITGSLVMPFTILILARTAILIGFCAALFRGLRGESLSAEPE